MNRHQQATPDLKVSVWIFWNKLPIRFLTSFCLSYSSSQYIVQVGFNYNIELVEDNNYGAFNLTTKVWNGLVRVGARCSERN